MTSMKKGEMLNAILVAAVTGHSGQFDRGGNPYILHPIAVMNLLPPDACEELRCIAIGHDLIEDTKMTYTELAAMGMSPRVIDGIKRLTKIPGESYDEYKERVKGSEDSMIVKMADLKHNTDITRLKGVTEKDMTRTARYFSFYVELKHALEGKK